uniref:Post-GPI attachment to proteins factor 3 n=1 Tax=Haptolina ericina TaxID=156174 RepID=A0A7S3BM04_9EUKA|mmetsp:Transcript_61484/g.136985  ORF Transcript_61484/g.136985 Transcript_61484/m.136985 type:complete len:140 (+) Transcript_61484:16-435(+)
MIIQTLLNAATTSLGDRDPAYRTCVDVCTASTGALSLSLRVFGWSEVDDCKYRCAWSQTDARLEKGLPPLQYHGKWAFIRMGDIQEPLSVLFSLANVAAHGAGLHHSGVISSTARHRCAHLLNPAWVRSDQAVATGGCG